MNPTFFSSSVVELYHVLHRLHSRLNGIILSTVTRASQPSVEFHYHIKHISMVFIDTVT